ncbi:prepilin peptidase [Alteromonas gilva]|uniref:Prepilin leader peptidase/N-methyltransferase n=1 Tax=Alteromonas gilva TaxID=2987522 RepID=A0ABT5KZH8_9ALTE|nr:A24 family peptidase [Alteromonas gilva]MDC8830175.1 A24 family peptidase [Alteromonas gilva]
MQSVIDLCLSQPWFFYTLVGIVSLMVGSFLNVVIYRLPVMMERDWQREYQSYFSPDEPPVHTERFDLVKPDSTCPGCGHKIRFWENIPLISYALLGGQCSQCKTSISFRYPVVELLTALLSVWIAAHFGPSPEAFVGIVLTWLLVAMTFIDLDKMILPDQLTLPLLWIGLLASIYPVFVAPADAILGAAIGYLILWSIYWAFKLLTGKEGMGYGDFKLLAALGAFTGWQGLLMIILLSSFVGAVFGIVIMLRQKQGKDMAIPFGPYLAIAGWLTLMYQDTITTAYFNWIMG